jgi:hypothetical protein
MWKTLNKTAAAAAVALAFAAAPACAQVEWGDFNQFGTSGNVAAYAKDLGGLLGSGTFHTGRGLGFPGFDIGFQGAYQFNPSTNDSVMKQSGVKGFGMPWIEAEIGMPLKFDGFIRGFSWDGMTVAGGGLRYALKTIEDVKGVPQFLLVGDGESFSAEDFRGTHFGLDLVISANYDWFRPYLGAGVDDTLFIPNRSELDPQIINESFSEYGYRLTAGASFRPFPFTYLTAAFSMRNQNPGVQAGAGLRF